MPVTGDDSLTAIYAVTDNNGQFCGVPVRSPRLNQVRMSMASKRDFGRGGLCRMRRAFGLSLSLIALVSFVATDTLAAGSGKSLATISGTVRDNRGNPLAVSYTHLRAHET